MKRKLVTIKRFKRPQFSCVSHGEPCEGHIRLKIETEHMSPYWFWLCDAGLAELIAALNKAAEKVKPGAANEG